MNVYSWLGKPYISPHQARQRRTSCHQNDPMNIAPKNTGEGNFPQYKEKCMEPDGKWNRAVCGHLVVSRQTCLSPLWRGGWEGEEKKGLHDHLDHGSMNVDHNKSPECGPSLVKGVKTNTWLVKQIFFLKSCKARWVPIDRVLKSVSCAKTFGNHLTKIPIISQDPLRCYPFPS